MSKFAAVVLALAAASSSSSSGGPGGTVSAPIKGKTFAVQDALAIASTQQVMVVLSSNADECVPPAQQVQHPGETALLLILDDYDMTSGKHTAPSAPATYTISATLGGTAAHNAVVEGNILDATCVNNADNDAVADAGTVVLTAVKDGTFTGTFDVMMDSGDHVKGTFDAPTCAEQRNPAPTCQ